MTASDAEVALAAALAGAAVVRGRLGTPLVRHLKSGQDFATDVDIAAESAIRDVIHASRPEDTVVGEEAGRSGGGSGRTWLVDPLCGTANFAAGTPGLAVNVALRAAGVMVVSAVADPVGNELLWADTSSAYLRRGAVDTPLVPTAESRLVELNLDPPFPSAPGFRCLDLLSDADFCASFRPRVLSTSLALAWVAAGHRAAYVTDGDVRDSVHFAAGVALCVAAGCTVTDLDGRPWPEGRDGLLAAADAVTHQTLLSRVAALKAFASGGGRHVREGHAEPR